MTLAMTGIDLPPYALRTIKQTHEIIPQAQQQRRTVNSILRNFARDEWQKIKSTITCTDQQDPGFTRLKLGTITTIDCVFWISYRTSAPGVEPRYPVVESYADGDYTFYRPRIVMMVINHRTEWDDNNAVSGWVMEVEEV